MLFVCEIPPLMTCAVRELGSLKHCSRRLRIGWASILKFVLRLLAFFPPLFALEACLSQLALQKTFRDELFVVSTCATSWLLGKQHPPTSPSPPVSVPTNGQEQERQWPPESYRWATESLCSRPLGAPDPVLTSPPAFLQGCGGHLGDVHSSATPRDNPLPSVTTYSPSVVLLLTLYLVSFPDRC